MESLIVNAQSLARIGVETILVEEKRYEVEAKKEEKQPSLDH